MGRREMIIVLDGVGAGPAAEFDAKYGHRRDPQGMAENLRRFDDRVPEPLGALSDEDILVITADHGNDPTFKGTDHTGLPGEEVLR